ncbi:DUF4309 domain-containing protein [Brevibacillus borstelensis]|uniref:DUF4309 domain-containing protein n=1 Tax=Brevibacillus borstelensis TaxID=45462 RepID=UPI0030BE5B30
MKRFVLGIALASVVVAGCQEQTKVSSPQQAAAGSGNTSETEAGQSSPSSIEKPTEETGHQTTGSSQEAAAGNPKVILDENFLPGLTNNKLNGFNISIGSSLQEVSEKYGQVTSKDFYDGGQYHAFEHLQRGFVFFNGKEQVYAIDLSGYHLSTTSLEEIKKALGTPASEGADEMDGGWLLVYEAGDNTVYLHAEDAKFPVEKIRVINKKILEESPQNL